MAKAVENKSFQWIAISSGIFITLALIGGAVGFQIHKQKKAEAKKAAEVRAINAFEARSRSNLVRVYQNLKLGHFLAAYKNMEGIETPLPGFVEIYREYHEVLARIADGLIEGDFLNEADSFLLRLINVREFEDRARESQIRVASRRRWKSAGGFMAEGKKLLDLKKYQDAVAEFAKAKAEYESVKLFKIHNVDQDLATLSSLSRAARYQIFLADAQMALADAEKSLVNNFFKEAQERTQKAGGLVARAAFYGGRQEEVIQLRKKLVALEAEITFRVPNSIPIWNRIELKDIDAKNHGFFLKEASFDLKDPEKVKIQIKYAIEIRDRSQFVIRYKAHLEDGRFFFDGKILDQAVVEKDVSSSFDLKIPPEFKGRRIKKIDLQVHDGAELQFSRVQRAFRLAAGG